MGKKCLPRSHPENNYLTRDNICRRIVWSGEYPTVLTAGEWSELNLIIILPSFEAVVAMRKEYVGSNPRWFSGN